jgi:protein farnesyltransferase subunit beta
LEQLDASLFDNAAEWIVLCQTYEGGFGATPETEAHGGYTFCGIAALKLLGKETLMDLDGLMVNL